MVNYIRPGTVGYGLTTYIRLRDEFCNTENGYNKILSGLNSLLNFQMIHSCMHTQMLQEHSHLHHFDNHRLEAGQLVITSHEHSHLFTKHLHHGTHFHHNLIMSQLSQSFPFSPSLSFPFPIPIYKELDSTLWIPRSLIIHYPQY